MGDARSEAVTVEGYRRLLSAVEAMALWAGLSEGDLRWYYTPLWQLSGEPTHELDASTMMLQFAMSLQESGRMRNTVKLTPDNIGAFREALCDFVPKRIVAELIGAEGVLAALRKRGITGAAELLSGKGRLTNWGKYAKGIFTAAEYLCAGGVASVNSAILLPAGCEWDMALMSDLPQEISQAVTGLGPALTLDFLKECGCLWASKPDTHIAHVLAGLSGADSGEMPALGGRGTVRLMFDIAASLRDRTGDPTITPYKLDKLIWLASTGDFYNDGVHGHRAIATRLLGSR